jgi:hypothetical protein
VSARFYGLDSEIRTIFFALEPHQLDRVLKRYEAAHGSSAKQYAAKTYSSWRSGAVEPSAATLERLLQHVPEVLPIHQRAELLALLRKRSRKVPNKRIQCVPDDAELIVTEELTSLLGEGLHQDTPAHVKSALAWLSCDSMQTAETILRIGEVLEAKWLAQAANHEIVRLRDALQRAMSSEGRLIGRFSHRVETPYAILDVTIGAPSALATLLGLPQPRRRMSDLTPRKPDDLLAQLTSDLSDKDKTDLRRVAANEQLSLDAKAREATMRHQSSGAEIDRHLDAAERLQYGEKSSGFTVSGAYKGASGTTNIEVKRSEPAAAMIKWIVVGAAIAAALYFLMR